MEHEGRGVRPPQPLCLAVPQRPRGVDERCQRHRQGRLLLHRPVADDRSAVHSTSDPKHITALIQHSS
eukprot:scaffold344245_cov51-Prasinocladus_malaysianus.AAC.1